MQHFTMDKAEPDDPRAAERRAMVDGQIARRGVDDARVLEAMARIPRHRFVPEELVAHAYEDRPLGIGHGQTISQPFIVAVMTAALGLRGGERVLEIGTGCGYQTAVFSALAGEVFTIEIVEPLARRAAEVLAATGCTNVRTRCGDGFGGWPEAAPFDAIMVTCAPDAVPDPLISQLAEGGRMVIPVGAEGAVQELLLLRKSAAGLEREKVLDVRFVPMTGTARE